MQVLTKITSSYKEIRLHQTPKDNIIYLFFTRYISASISALIVKTKITPNQISYSMFFFGLIGAYFFSLGAYSGYFLGGLFYIFLNIADTVDGEVARYTKRVSNFGDYLDRLVHYITNSAMIIGLGIGVFINTNENLFLYIFTIFLLLYLVDDLSRDLLISCGIVQNKNRKSAKEKLSITRKNNLIKFAILTASTSGFWHLIVIISLIDYYAFSLGLLSSPYFVIYLYLGYFLFINLVKTILRLRLIFLLGKK